MSTFVLPETIKYIGADIFNASAGYGVGKDGTEEIVVFPSGSRWCIRSLDEYKDPIPNNINTISYGSGGANFVAQNRHSNYNNMAWVRVS